ncbi:post-transcriptional regulator [Jeotgalibacillus soli]|uniref:Post-transcriptional regulator n=1 Tax=Jeotgalibacillus soli TaxID=889306 RepID=A0A0C2V6E1_9BACL|nr:post-transcriptional regulator [Jeotgalibacillus soli]KIL44527.1 hypothetical protein KP78_34910 [Jeotgalibacillus soli]
MNKNMSLNEALREVGPALESKEQELLLLGYDTVTMNELWDYLVSKKWKKRTGDFLLHEMVSDILSIKPGDFMNYTTQKEYKTSSMSLDLNDEELQLLLHGQLNDKKNSNE